MSKRSGIKSQWKAEVEGKQLPLPIPIDPKILEMINNGHVEVFSGGAIVWNGVLQDLKPLSEVWAYN